MLNGSITTPYWYQGDGTVLGFAVVVPHHQHPHLQRRRRPIASPSRRPARCRATRWTISSSARSRRSATRTTGTGAGTAGPDGGLYTSQTETGLGNNGYGTINGGIAPLDTDGDGMPDYWEAAIAA